MSTSSLLGPFGLLVAMTSLVIGAEPAPKCSRIAQDVTESVSKEPAKVLMIVEDALVINEGCACEIIKAAISASKADMPMVKQIVATAVAVAPKMTPVIMECANVSSPGAVDEVTTVSNNTSGKDAKSVQPVTVEEPKSGSDYSGAAGIRGVYLMAPAVGGFVSAEPEPEEEEEDEKPRKDKPEHMSPSCTSPDGH